MIDENTKLTRVELDIVRLRYLAGLCNQHIADFLGLTLHQVKYRIKKPNVQKFFQEFIWPHIRDTAICNVIYKLVPCTRMGYTVKKRVAKLYCPPGKDH